MGEREASREARVARPKRTGAYSSRALGRRRGRGGGGAALRGAAARRARRRRQRCATHSMHSDVFPQGRRMAPTALDRKYSKHITVATVLCVHDSAFEPTAGCVASGG